MVERLDPKTGEIKLIASPTPNSSPYGMAISSKAVPYFCEFGANKLASIEPATLAIREYALPHADSRARSMAITNNDIAWYTDYSRDYLGKFDSLSGNFSEYPRRADHNLGPTESPSPKGAVWYSRVRCAAQHTCVLRSGERWISDLDHSRRFGRRSQHDADT
ncbi:MAG: hypothetical protein JO105_05950 [Hyphomicrobiales bacterium]|nr:hypothetical protein [Hyphomicrobiales bacterium]